jgi:hypothetical protein
MDETEKRQLDIAVAEARIRDARYRLSTLRENPVVEGQAAEDNLQHAIDHLNAALVDIPDAETVEEQD